MKKAFCKTAAASLLIVTAACICSCTRKQQEQVAGETQIIQETKVPETKIDLDLSSMNYNMISSITFEMLIEPQKYVDKSVKISGECHTEMYEGTRYYSVIVWDATQCCPAGLDFIPPEAFQFPDDFPQDGEKITVTGKMLEDTESGELLYVASSIET